MQAVLPLEVTRINSFQPCESCSLRRSHYQVTLDPPGRPRVEHRLCDTCVEAVRR